MADLEQLAHPGVRVRGLAHDDVVEVVSVEHFGDHMLEIVYRAGSGDVAQRLVSRDEATGMELVAEGDQWSFDGDPAAFKLAAEARRIRLAHLFDPLLAVNGSLVDPYPHQIAAVYEEMLPRQPLRFLLADDPGAGKTIMAGLLIKELVARGDLTRCLVVAPGSLAEQWQEELWEKFRLEFSIINAQSVHDDPDANPFLRVDRAVISLDRLKRDELREKVVQKPWDLVIVDEAHKMSARYFGDELKRSQRFALGQALSDPNVSRHFLLMTATPHNGKEEDFQAFMSLLDQDRFHGRYRKGEHDSTAGDMMRRLVKEQMVKFDGSRLFPERRAETVGFDLSDQEQVLYDEVTTYVREEMGRAQQIAEGGDKRRGNFIGFALALLQRRLASSPEAIYQSLKRRRGRLEAELGEARIQERAGEVRRETAAIDRIFADEEMLADIEDDVEDIEALEDAAMAEGHAGRDVASLEWELAQVHRLEKLAGAVRASGTDSKWVALENLLNSDAMIDEDGSRRKLIVFTEHKDTLEYLADNVRRLHGSDDAVVTISGSTKREHRRDVQQAFRQDPIVKVLIATDAAGEGINLQNANLMVNYDLPWNPNRLEQRFGRIHRIGQTEVCFMWNLVATDTREGEVFKRLFDKLEVERRALGTDGVFDVLGEVFEGHDLRDLLLEAIRYGNQPEVRNRIFEKVEGAVDADHLHALLEQRAIAKGTFDEAKLQHVREEMERAAARRMQPHFIKAFFTAAFQHLGGRLHERAHGRLEITRVPAAIRQSAGRLGGARLLERYERVCFDKNLVNIQGERFAEFVCPGHPLLDATVDAILHQHRHLLTGGAVLIDPTDEGTEPRALCLLEHTISDARDTASGKRVISRRMQFVELDEKGEASDAGPAPYLDYEIVPPEVRTLLLDAARSDWLGEELERAARDHAIRNIALGHLDEVKRTRVPRIEHTIQVVRERLNREINHYDERAAIAQENIEAGKPEGRMNRARAEQIADDLRARLAARLTELDKQKQIASTAPTVTGRALIIPAGLLRKVAGDVTPAPIVDEHSPDPIARARIEKAAMNAVTAIETRLGRDVKDVSAAKVGWDLEAWDHLNKQSPRFIEVKGRALGAGTVTVTRNEALAALNKGNDFILAIVIIDGDDIAETIYVPHPFTQELEFHVTSVTCEIERMRELAIDPATLAPHQPAHVGSTT